MSNEFEKLIEEHFKNETLPKRGSIINTTVLQINSDFVIVDVGSKAEATISKKEFSTLPKIGEEIAVFVESANPSQIKLSYAKAQKQSNVGELKIAFNAKTPVNGTIKKILPNGYIVELMGWDAFLPFSQVSLSPNLDEAEKKKYLSQTLPFIILKLEERGERPSILVGRKSLLFGEKGENIGQLLDKLTIGDIMDGKVVKVNEKSVLVEIAPNVVGLVRIGDISWERIKIPSDKLKEKDTVKVKILDINKEKKQILLSIKDVKGDMWKEFETKNPVGTVLEGIIDSIADTFVIVTLQEGIKGFLHKSNISWAAPVDVKKLYKVGQKIKVKVLNFEPIKKKISLGVKQLEENPWTNFEKDHKIGDKVNGTIVRKVDFGLFIDIGNNIQAMIHKNDLSWNVREQNLSKYNIGEKIECYLDKIDIENQKISCSLKQREGNPWKTFSENYSIGSLIKGTIKSIDAKGYIIEFKEGIEAFLPTSQAPRETELKVGDAIDVLITDLNAAKNIIKISIRAIKDKENKEMLKEYMTTKDESHEELPTLGDIFDKFMDKKGKK